MGAPIRHAVGHGRAASRASGRRDLANRLGWPPVGGKLPARKGCFEHEIRNGPLPFKLILLMFNTVC